MAVTSSKHDPLPSVSKRGVRALVAATGLSATGDGLFYAAAPLAAAAITRNPTAVAVVAAAEWLPWILVAPFAGAYIDRWPRRTIMIVADVVRAVVLALLAVLVANEAASIAALAVCAFILLTGTVFHSAASEAVVADLTDRDEHLLNTTNGRLNSVNTAGKQLAGPPVGSWSFSLLAWLPFAADALSFAAAAILTARVPRTAPIAAGARQGPLEALREGARYLVGHRELRVLCLLIAAGNLTSNMALATFVLFATDADGLNVSQAGYGLLLAAMAGGGVAGGLLVPRIVGALGRRATVVAGLAVEAVSWAVIPATHQPVIAAVALAVGWMAITAVSVVVIGARQRLVPRALLGRVINAFRVVGNGTSPLGSMAGGLIAAAAGLRVPLMVAAVLMGLTVLLALRVRLDDPADPPR